MVTEGVRQSLATIAPWLQAGEPFVLVGPEGCGKSTLLQHCFDRLPDVRVAVVHCNAQTSAANVIQKLVQVRPQRYAVAADYCYMKCAFYSAIVTGSSNSNSYLDAGDQRVLSLRRTACHACGRRNHTVYLS